VARGGGILYLGFKTGGKHVARGNGNEGFGREPDHEQIIYLPGNVSRYSGAPVRVESGVE